MSSLLLALVLLAWPQRLPDLAELAAPPAPTGAESALVDLLGEHLPDGLVSRRDVFGSLVVRRADATAPVTTLVAVGIDTTGYVVSRIRADGYLRLRTLGERPTPENFHLLHEGRPVSVLTRHGPVNGVAVIPSVHLGGERPDSIGEEHLWIDVGADDARDVAGLGIEMLDPVVSHEVVTLSNGAVAGPGVGRRAVALSLLRWLASSGAGAVPEELAIAFVVQSLPGPGRLGRGGESLLRAHAPRRVVVLDAGDGEEGTSERDGVTWTWHELRIAHAGTPVELVTPEELVVFEQRLGVWMEAEGAGR